MRRSVPAALPLLLSIVLLCCCAQTRKVGAIRRNGTRPSLSTSGDVKPSSIRAGIAHRDTITVLDPQGRQLVLMNAVQDENGEMVAVDVINPVVVTATFKNLAERHGKVDLRFDVVVPPEMLDSHWQIRLAPVLYMMGGAERLDSILITGEGYRREQLLAYGRYDRYLRRIVTDPEDLLRRRDLDIFLSRDVKDVLDDEVNEHYTNTLQQYVNERRIAGKEKAFRRMVKVPLVTEGLRLDTVIVSTDGSLNYTYVQTIAAPPGLRKAGITLDGGIFEGQKELVSLSGMDTLSFYISSMSSLVRDDIRYKSRIVERVARTNSVCWIEFAPGKSRVDESLGNNLDEIARIRHNFDQILEGDEFILDSVVVLASSSPEGPFSVNKTLSGRRSKEVCDYFKVDGVRFVPRSEAENWRMFETLVRGEGTLSAADKEDIAGCTLAADPDERDRRLSKRPYYRYLREHVYPRLRTVRFDFHLHRRGMLKDTVWTTEPDSVYLAGVQAIRDRDYKLAVSLLREYSDFNTALAFASLDYNASALNVLEGLPDAGDVYYLKALVLSRRGEEREAVESYLKACDLEPSFVHRGNLDPEISFLINKFKIDNILENDYYEY